MELAKVESRNEFVSKAIERYIGELMVGDGNGYVNEKIAEAVAKYCNESNGKVANGLFRYAVFVDVMIQMMSDYMEIPKGQLQKYRDEAYKNVRRTRGQISLTNALKHAETDCNDD